MGMRGRQWVALAAAAIHHLYDDGRLTCSCGWRRSLRLMVDSSSAMSSWRIILQIVTPIDGDYDRPSTLAEQVEWLVATGLALTLSGLTATFAVDPSDLDQLSSLAEPPDENWWARAELRWS